MTELYSTTVRFVFMAGLTLLSLCQTAHIKKVVRRSVTCDRSEFACTSDCIPNIWACDGDSDCSGGEDELPSLCEDRVCPHTYFKCDGNKCFPCEDINDGFPDCNDSSDEGYNGTCPTPPPTT
ncbi:very low-density lipoprotein receptor-like [Pecten maximus]|uniref:very low-density lipoprotein receptor-like n=1 Tax=Pecten maximus TaxID=6579 RepID=UPI0014584929|nr:very low-density lipoprotein receptor-like [Pecten maximus]